MKRYIQSQEYISAMATEQKKLIKQLESWEEIVTEHIAKCVMYGDSLGIDKYNHWVEHEIATWLSDANDILVKPFNKKLKPHDYQSTLFAGLGDDKVDARVALHELQRRNNKSTEPYPYVEVDDKMIEKMFEVSGLIVKTFVPILSDTNSLSKKDIETKLHEVLDPICLK